MARPPAPGFACTECGWTGAKWFGRCPECQAWGSIVERGAPTGKVAAASVPEARAAKPITAHVVEDASHRPTGIGEFDRVLGGGLVPGAAVLVSGEPGVGKSTLLLEVAARAARRGARVLYVSGEESAGQVRLRAERTGALDDEVLHLRPGSFFQTNTDVAAGLYRQARAWVDELAPASVWDLYCGVGGFALHVAGPGRRVLGIETSAPAVGGADAPDAVIVNPPRRGLGPELCATLEASSVGAVVYSSCNAVSLARDLAAMPSLRPRRIRVFDMFPQTEHYEVMVLLERVS